MINFRSNIEQVYKRSNPHIRHTPLEHSPYLSNFASANVFLKLDNIQKTGSSNLEVPLAK